MTAVARDPERGALSGAHQVPTNVVDEGSCIAAVASHVARFDRLDLLVNAAGVGFGGPFEQASTRSFDLQFAVNVRGLFLVCRSAIPHLRASRGLVVNVASITGVAPQPGLAVYGATKHAVRGLSGAMQAELRDAGVRVTTLCPGFVDTPMTDFVKGEVPGDEMIRPADCVAAVRFLLALSPACRIPEIVIDGPTIPDLARSSAVG